MRIFIGIACIFLAVALITWKRSVDSISVGAVDLASYSAQKDHALGENLTPLNLRYLSVEEAYRSIPHERTKFRTEISRIPRNEAGYLNEMFELVDASVVERVHHLHRLQRGDMSTLDDNNYNALLHRLKILETPKDLLPAEALIVEALGEQHEYLTAWSNSGSARYFSPSAPLIQSSHRKLLAAYYRLIELYDQEGRHNQKAFFDHLCALDFI